MGGLSFAYEGWEYVTPRIAHEAKEEIRVAEEDPEYGDPAFPELLDQYTLARDVYTREYQRVKGEIERIRKEAEEAIASLEQEVLNATADEVERKYGDIPIVGWLRNNDMQSVVNW